MRALAQPWVAYVVHPESQRDGTTPTRIVRPIPVHDAGGVRETLLETTFVDRSHVCIELITKVVALQPRSTILRGEHHVNVDLRQ